MFTNLKPLTLALFALALSAGVVFATAPGESQEPVYSEGGHYTAVLNQQTQAWRLLPADGIDLTVSAAESGCLAGRTLPEGVWLVTSDAQGKPVLRAPSTTALPHAYPDQVALRACGDGGDGAPHVSAPQGLIDWLAYNTGAIYVEN